MARSKMLLKLAASFLAIEPPQSLGSDTIRVLLSRCGSRDIISQLNMWSR